MARIACALLVGTVLASPAAAQPPASRFYLGATAAADGGSRGPIPGGAFPSAGALFGVRLTRAWSVEVEGERGFRTTSTSNESIWISYPPSPTPTREDIERYGIRARFDRSQQAGTGWSALVMWRSREPGRVNVGLIGGVSARRYRSRVVRTATFVPPGLDLPPTHPSLQDEDSTRRMTGGGVTAGVAFLVRVSGAFAIAPEFRYTHGLITDDPYRVFRSGVRATWDF